MKEADNPEPSGSLPAAESPNPTGHLRWLADPPPWVAITALIAIAVIGLLLLLSDSAAHQARLKSEFDRLPLPPGAVRVSTPSGVAKPFLASFGASYQSTMQPTGIIDFYQLELGSRGWQDAGSRVRAGMTTKCFEKQDVRAAITPSIDRPGEFDVGLTWGAGLCSEVN